MIVRMETIHCLFKILTLKPGPNKNKSGKDYNLSDRVTLVLPEIRMQLLCALIEFELLNFS